MFKKVRNFRKLSKIAIFHTHLFLAAHKIGNFGSNNDAVENRTGGSKSPSHGLINPPCHGFRKAVSKNVKKRCLPSHTNSRYKKSIFTLFVHQSCRGTYNLPFFVLGNEYFFVRIEKNKNFCEKNNFESDFFFIPEV